MADMTPLERAAQALKEEAERLHREGLPQEVRDFMAGRGDSGWICLVRAVLISIREPSEAMIDAGLSAISGCYEQRVEETAADSSWQAMLDAALAEAK